MYRRLWIVFFVLSLFLTVAYGAIAQASLAPTYDMYTDDDHYVLAVTCHGGQLRLWTGGQYDGTGILFCESEDTPTPTPQPIYTASPLIGGGSGRQQYFFPYVSSEE